MSSEPAYGSDYRPDTGEGWLTFAGIMIIVLGVLNAIWGIAAIDRSNQRSTSGGYIGHRDGIG